MCDSYIVIIYNWCINLYVLTLYFKLTWQNCNTSTRDGLGVWVVCFEKLNMCDHLRESGTCRASKFQKTKTLWRHTFLRLWSIGSKISIHLDNTLIQLHISFITKTWTSKDVITSYSFSFLTLRSAISAWFLQAWTHLWS